MPIVRIGNTRTPYHNITNIKAMPTGGVVIAGMLLDDVRVDFEDGQRLIAHDGNGNRGFLAYINEDGVFEWFHTLASDHRNRVDDIDIGPNGDIYLAGEFFYAIDLDPGSDSTKLVSPYSDLFVARFSPTGNFIAGFNWSHADTTTDLRAHQIVVRDNGNIVIAGYHQNVFTDEFTFSSDVPVAKVRSGNRYNLFVTELDTAGRLQWVRGLAVGEQTTEPEMVLRPDGGIGLLVSVGYYSTGDYLTDTIALFEDGFGNADTLLTGRFSGHILLGLDATGDLEWSQLIGLGASDQPQHLACTASGKLFLNTSYRGGANRAVDLDPSDGVWTAYEREGFTYDGYLARYDAYTGAFEWASDYGSNGSDRAGGLAVDDYGNVYGVAVFSPSVRLEGPYYEVLGARDTVPDLVEPNASNGVQTFFRLGECGRVDVHTVDDSTFVANVPVADSYRWFQLDTTAGSYTPVGNDRTFFAPD